MYAMSPKKMQWDCSLVPKEYEACSPYLLAIEFCRSGWHVLANCNLSLNLSSAECRPHLFSFFPIPSFPRSVYPRTDVQPCRPTDAVRKRRNAESSAYPSGTPTAHSGWSPSDAGEEEDGNPIPACTATAVPSGARWYIWLTLLPDSRNS